MADRVSPVDMRAHIALLLQAEVKQYEIEAVCDRLGMPPATEGAWDYNSKRVYVQNRLVAVDAAGLQAIARAVAEEFGDEQLERMLGGDGVRGVDGDLKNLIFAATGPKPRIVLRDAINNVVEIVEGADRCLVYDRPLPPAGLTWGNLLDWWREREGARSERDAAESLYRRLSASLASPPERLLFKTYCGRYADEAGRDVPALIPQVYLHYDPYTKRELVGVPGEELARQRMDFLLLPSERTRIVVEVDGKHHYANDDGAASPSRYAEMVREDRAIRLDGYEVFRFGDGELHGSEAERLVDGFFQRLLALHSEDSRVGRADSPDQNDG